MVLSHTKCVRGLEPLFLREGVGNYETDEFPGPWCSGIRRGHCWLFFSPCFSGCFAALQSPLPCTSEPQQQQNRGSYPAHGALGVRVRLSGRGTKGGARCQQGRTAAVVVRLITQVHGTTSLLPSSPSSSSCGPTTSFKGPAISPVISKPAAHCIAKSHGGRDERWDTPGDPLAHEYTSLQATRLEVGV